MQYWQPWDNPVFKHTMKQSELFKLFFENNLKFNVCIDSDKFQEYTKAIGEYGNFNPKKVNQVLGISARIEKDIIIKIGREYSPVIYIEIFIDKSTNAEELTKKFRQYADKMRCDEFSANNFHDVKIEFRFWWD